MDKKTKATAQTKQIEEANPVVKFRKTISKIPDNDVIDFMFFDILSLFRTFFYSRRNSTVGSTGSKAFGDTNLWICHKDKHVWSMNQESISH